jgi:hypothetical protein
MKRKRRAEILQLAETLRAKGKRRSGRPEESEAEAWGSFIGHLRKHAEALIAAHKETFGEDVSEWMAPPKKGIGPCPPLGSEDRQAWLWRHQGNSKAQGEVAEARARREPPFDKEPPEPLADEPPGKESQA